MKKCIKSAFGAAAGLSLFLLLGTVGALDREILPLLPGMIRCIIFLVAWIVSTYAAGAFDSGRDFKRSDTHEDG